MVVDQDGLQVTARTDHSLLTVGPTITPGGLRLEAPGADALEVAIPDPASQTPVQAWSSHLTAAVASAAAADWLTELLHRPVRLVHLDDPTRRPTSPEFSEPTDRVSFADGYPLLATTTASLAALNQAITTQPVSPSAKHPDPGRGQAAVPMHRFRPSIVIDGGTAWAEDDWRLIRIGEATFRAVKGCARCVMTTLEPDHGTGDIARGHEPTRTLARLRKFGSGIWFGVNLIPDSPGATIRAGDPVEILRAVEPGGGPLGA